MKQLFTAKQMWLSYSLRYENQILQQRYSPGVVSLIINQKIDLAGFLKMDLLKSWLFDSAV